MADQHLGQWLDSMDIERRPDIALFIGQENLVERIARMEAEYGAVEIIGRSDPGFVDRVVHWLNPVNRNETIVLARLRPHHRTAD